MTRLAARVLRRHDARGGVGASRAENAISLSVSTGGICGRSCRAVAPPKRSSRHGSTFRADPPLQAHTRQRPRSIPEGIGPLR